MKAADRRGKRRALRKLIRMGERLTKKYRRPRRSSLRMLRRADLRARFGWPAPVPGKRGRRQRQATLALPQCSETPYSPIARYLAEYGCGPLVEQADKSAGSRSERRAAKRAGRHGPHL